MAKKIRKSKANRITALIIVGISICMIMGCTPLKLEFSFNNYRVAEELYYKYMQDRYSLEQSASMQRLLTEYIISAYDRPFDDYTDDELHEKYLTDMKIYFQATQFGFNSEDMNENEYTELITTNISLEAESTDSMAQNDKEFKKNLEQQADIMGLEYDDFIVDIMVPYYKLYRAKIYLQKYYFNHIYNGEYKTMYQKQLQLQESEDAFDEYVEYIISEDYQKGYISFMKDFEAYCESL